MSDEVKLSLKQKFDKLAAGQRTAIIGGGVSILLLGLGTIFTDDGKGPKQVVPKVQQENLTVFNPGNTNATEGVAAGLHETNKGVQAQEQKIKLLEEQVRQAQAENKGTDGHWNEVANLVQQVQALQERVNSMQQNGTSPNAAPPVKDKNPLDGILPRAVNSLKETLTGQTTPAQPPAASGTGAEQSTAESPAPSSISAPVITIQVTGGVDKRVKKDVVKKEAPPAYIPTGANFEAVLLNGMDASTAISANKNPTPALLRVKTDAILPNMGNFNVRECFIMAGGFGNISTERVELRTESMSCINDKGEVFEGKIEGYLVGEDGKAGARGRVVSKQGALLAKSFMAGFVGGLGNAFTPQPVQSLNITGASQEYQYPNMDQVVGTGLSTGLNKSSQALASFYIKLAEQMFPIVELDAGRKMTIILIKGVELKAEKKS